ncbi:MAG: polysaccharide deacetylase family protein [Anaerolineales bacterium]
MPNPLAIALKGKGVFNVVRRGASIASRYGLTTARLDVELRRLTQLIQHYNCPATLPITSVVLRRNPRLIQRYQAQGIEFAIHGYRHVDYSALPVVEQRRHLATAQRIFAKAGITLHGFRAPYLRRNRETLTVLRELGLRYDASPAYAWEVLTEPATPVYARVLEFFGAQPAARYPVVPSLEADVVRIPYSMPDDESLIERLGLTTVEEMSALWVSILRQSHRHGELFTLGLHPERTSLCYEPLRAVLAEAHTLRDVWMARLDAVAEWWRERLQTKVELTEVGPGGYYVAVTGSRAVTVLVRGGTVNVDTLPWADGYRRVTAASFVINTPARPIIGLSPHSAVGVAPFLRQQGYIVDTNAVPGECSVYVDQPTFAAEDQRQLLDQIESSTDALVRLGRWPNGARSALSVTGDIDALTLWDYGLRFVEQ